MFKYLGFFIIVILLTGFQGKAQDYEQIESLTGYWKFSVGDDGDWAAPNYNDSDWDEIKVPDSWENQGYDDYNGYAWYRKTFKWDKFEMNIPLFLLIGNIDDADEVYLNGEFLGKTGAFPPNFVSKWGEQRVYRIPTGKLRNNVTNTIAVRVYDYNGGGGIRGGRVGIYYDYDIRYLDFPLSGEWKFKMGRNKEWSQDKYPDQDWETIFVPATWESQGHNYDGYACYRKTFRINKDFDDDMYLVLGKVDDFDHVYLNGEFLGSYKDIKRSFQYTRENQEWLNIRYYPIPENLLKKGTNQITVHVYDHGGLGGIYAGPVGLTSAYNCNKLKRKYQRSRSLFEVFIESVFD